MPKTLVTVDLGGYTIKALQVTQGKKLLINKSAQVFNSLGTSLAGDENTAQKIIETVDNFFNDYALPRTNVALSLPEFLVSTKIISIPTLSDAELASAIMWQAEQHIPIPLEELSLEYQVIFRPSRGQRDAEMRVLMVGARKSVIEKYIDVFLRAGIEPVLLETHTLSVIRSLQFTPEDPPTLVVHMGAYHTDMMIVSEGELRFVYTNPNGGQAYSRAIEQAAQLDPKQAEQYKRTYGLEPTELQGKIRDILLTPIKATLNEMRKTIQFFLSQQQSAPIKRILLSGGSAQMPGLVQYITEQLGMEVLIAAPFTGLEGDLPKTDQPAYTVCMGMAMKENR